MTITLSYLECAWEKYNKKYFKGELRKPMFSIDNRKNRLGCFYNNIPRISISKYYDRSEKQFDETIIHEMIHQYIRQNNIKDTRPHHGAIFKSIAARINRDGWNIQTRCDLGNIGISSNKTKTYHVFCFPIRSCGKYMTIVVNANYVTKYRLHLLEHYPYHKYKVSNDPKYGVYPACRNLIRGKYCSKEEYVNFLEE